MLYSDKFLRDIMRMINDDSEWPVDEITPLPGRGLVSLIHLDGLFNADTILHLDDHRIRTQIAIERLRDRRYEGLEPFLDGEPVNESLLLVDSQGAVIILHVMYNITLNDCIQDAGERDESDTWTDLTIALRRATDTSTINIYTQEFCEKLVELVGYSIHRLNEEGWSRHRSMGIMPINLLPTSLADSNSD